MNHYDFHPYPYSYDTLDERLCYVKSYISQPVGIIRDNIISRSIMIVGCGWSEAVSTALHCPDKVVIGIDGSRKVIGLAQQLQKELHLSNLTLHNTDFYNVKIEAKVDSIVMTGVLHHLENPKLALIRCRSFLNDKGCIAGMVYSSTRKFLDRTVQMFRYLGWSDPTNPSHLCLIRKYLEALPNDNPVKLWYQHYDKSDAEMIDTWMHYRYRTYSDGQLKKLLYQTGFNCCKTSSVEHKRTFMAFNASVAQCNAADSNTVN